MKTLISLLDFRYFLGRKQIFLYLFMLIYLVYAMTTGQRDLLLALSIIVFAISPLKHSFLMFVFYFLWENVTVFSFGLSGVMIMLVLMVVKIFIQHGGIFKLRNKLMKKSVTLQTGLLIYIVIMGVISFFVSGSTTGLNFVFKVLATFYAISYLYSDKAYDNLIKAILQILMISVVIATIYGFYHDTSVARWISGMGGAVNQLYGTMGTTRMGFFYLTSVTYFLYYVNNVVVKTGGIVLFSLLALMTVSLTITLLYFIVIGIYMHSKGSFMTFMIRCGALLLVSALTFPFWSKLDPVQPVIYRMEYSTDAYEAGDINAATTSRYDIQKEYTSKMNDPIKIIFGNARSSMSATGLEHNTHNTYLDIVFYFGIIGLVLFTIYQWNKFLLLRGRSYFYPLLTIKAMLLIGALTVSVMTSTYFMFLIFI